MHSRRTSIGGDTVTLRFGHEGVLYRGAFVMYDHQTESKWNHATGLALSGPLAGRRLRQLPARLVLWREWKRRHPNTRVLVGKGARNLLEYLSGWVGDYEAGPDNVDDFGVSFGRGSRTRLYPFSGLIRRPVINDTVARRPVVVTMEPETLQTAVFSRRVEGRVLRFEPAAAGDTGGSGPSRPLMRDRGTGTVWERLSGRAIRGPLEGHTLRPLVGVVWDRDRWEQIHPGGTVYRP